MALIETEQLATRQQVIVDNIEYLAIHSGNECS
jgi:hypothetical protein